MGMTWYHMVAAWLLAWVALVIVSQRSWAVSWLALGLMAAHIGDWAMKAAMNAMPRKNIDGNGKAVLITGEFRSGSLDLLPCVLPFVFLRLGRGNGGPERGSVGERHRRDRQVRFRNGLTLLKFSLA